METDKKIYPCFLFASSFPDDKEQVDIPIAAQLEALQKLAEWNDFNIHGVFIETGSVKDQNNRPVFEKMLSRIENGDADYVLCWSYKFLFRSPDGEKKVIDLLRQRKFQFVSTMDNMRYEAGLDDLQNLPIGYGRGRSFSNGQDIKKSRQFLNDGTVETFEAMPRTICYVGGKSSNSSPDNPCCSKSNNK